MSNRVSHEGILTFKALVLNGRMFSQIAKVCGNRDGRLIGYVLDEFQMATFIGEMDGKLFRTRQDYMMDTWAAQGREVLMADFETEIEKLKATLPQIFLK